MTTEVDDTRPATLAPSDEADGAATAAAEPVPVRKSTPRKQRTVAVSLRALSVAGAAVLAAGALVATSTLWWSVRSELHDMQHAAVNAGHAEHVATEYAVGASTINYQDFDGWVTKLKANTTTQLGAKFDATAPKLQQILTPLKWTSTAAPITAKVVSETNGAYKVDVFVDVHSTSAQTPDGAATTVSYEVTVDSGDGWKIADVGGSSGVLPIK